MFVLTHKFCNKTYVMMKVVYIVIFYYIKDYYIYHIDIIIITPILVSL